MSRDFAPKDHLMAHKMWLESGEQSPYLSNIVMRFSGKERLMYTEEELQDRQNHEALAVMGSDIYSTLREKLSPEKFNEINSILNELGKRYCSNDPLDDFPRPMLTWFFNEHKHYYHEPNDEEFVEYVLGN